MKKYILAIDQGTTSTRAIIFDQQANTISVAQKPLHNIYRHPGWVEQDANEIWASTVGVIFEALTKAAIKPQQLAAIGITNQRETTVVWDKETGTPIHLAIVWQSRQSNHYCENLKEQGKESLCKQKTGLLLDPYFSASKIRFILDETNQQIAAENNKLAFGTIDSWLVYKLTNGKKHITDVSNASRTLLMNLETLDYDDELLNLWNIPRCMLPEIHDTSEIYGYCQSIFDCDIPIASIVGDQQAALFGQTCFSCGDVKNTYGTGCFLLMNTGNTPIRSKHGLVTSVGWKINDDICYVLEGSVFIAGAAIQWLRDGLHLLTNAKESEERALEVKDSNGVYVVPAFTGLGAPYWKPYAKGAIFGLTRDTTQEHIIRATLESLAFQTADVIHAMEEDGNLHIENIKVDGGASSNDFLVQFQSDLLNTPIMRSETTETTALGAAYLAGLAVDFWKNCTELQNISKSSSIFKPIMNEKQRHKLSSDWKQAIEATIIFSEQE